MTDVYKGVFGCLNCENIERLEVEKGIISDKFLEEKKPKCSNCGCNNTLHTYLEFTAMKSLMKEFMMMHKMDEMHGDGREHDHIK